MEEAKNKQNLTPIAIVISGIIIAGAIVGKDSITNILKGKEVPPAKTEEPSAQVTLLDKFVIYAKDLGLDAKQFTSCIDSNKYQSQINEAQASGEALGVSGTPASFINGVALNGAQNYETFKVIIENELGSTQPLPDYLSDYKNQGYYNDVKKDIKILDTDPQLGSKDAKVTLVEFTDYQCPYCGKHASSTGKQIKSDYIDTGKIKFVLKDFPLTSIHPNAFKAAEAARCAGEQGKYWEMHDKLFESQSEWSPLTQK